MDFDKNDQQFDGTVCRVCQQEGCFEMSENEFHYEDTKVTLLTAFNAFSCLDNVSSGASPDVNDYSKLKLIHFLVH